MTEGSTTRTQATEKETTGHDLHPTAATVYSSRVGTRLLPIGVLISGRGTNLQAILNRCADRTLDAKVRLVVSNRPEAPGLAFSRDRGVPTYAVPRADHPSRDAQQRAIARLLREHGAELIVNAGFDQILDPGFVDQFRHRIVNVHPSLLPAFAGGMHAVREALDSGVRITGCTVHVVTEDVDAGPIILQEPVPVFEDDSEETLLGRIHEAEHRLLPAAIQLYAEGRVRVVGRRVHLLPQPDDQNI
ncbi:MAG: phosphoribosylglycinamide formyltransferase [Chloroflexi bacterium]|nr:phosphoribosylglycinamide formyltransferase [Chloroflexota bacterium]